MNYSTKMHLKLMFWHLIISVTTYFGIGFIHALLGIEIDKVVAALYLIIVIALYVLSGYIATDKTKSFSVKNYYIVALIGFIIWLLSFLSAPTDLQWKDGSVASWWVSRIYTAGIEGPLNTNGFSIPQHSVKYESALLFVLILIPCLLQACGGFLKVKLKKDRN